MPRILRPGLKAIRYLGKISAQFRGAAEGRGYITVNNGDIILVNEVTAVRMCRGTQYEALTTDIDIVNLVLESAATQDEGTTTDTDSVTFIYDNAEAADNKEALDEQTYVCSDDVCTQDKTENAAVSASMENIQELSDEELKAECKKYGIKYGKNKREDMIALLIPFLEQDR